MRFCQHHIVAPKKRSYKKKEETKVEKERNREEKQQLKEEKRKNAVVFPNGVATMSQACPKHAEVIFCGQKCCDMVAAR